ncbi:MAG: hypothetical protein ABIU63_08470 [Chitinophagaceae bacterium]
MYQSDYLSIPDAIADLHARGFCFDFSLQNNQLLCAQQNFFLHASECNILEMYRFSSKGNKKRNTLVYGIECPKYHLKGILMSTELQRLSIGKTAVMMDTGASTLGDYCWKHLLN